ncbi:alpha/beta fold family hydrolase [Burkholderia lata]|uniref:Alpha/beta fold family hydrolase n=1 Tax=Burkholderia lata (strain ATCC 17760 / DSM 23089 / LMG 22485 / NCIMB 9086 / R18194 / 383) TaxID=482957 RepID=A0A6P2UJ39_BURL3|nr:alpha/beta hydrolase [Burkholderia lata]VWC76718.1 alpha/beta fold family hydrolase [Burkholderia lata]
MGHSQQQSVADRWQTLPPTPESLPATSAGYADVNGVKIYHKVYGKGSPVLFLHGGMANTDWWNLQVAAVAKYHTVVLVDTRGHGRSTRDERPFSYNQMADDAIALMDKLGFDRAHIVGWSDGAITGLDLAMRYPERIAGVFAFAPNVTTKGVDHDCVKKLAFADFVERAGHEYEAKSATPTEYASFVEQIRAMWATQPNWSTQDLNQITVPVEMVGAQYDEAIFRDHLLYMADSIPNAGLVMLPNVSHFAQVQDPEPFNFAILHFLGDK